MGARARWMAGAIVALGAFVPVSSAIAGTEAGAANAKGPRRPHAVIAGGHDTSSSWLTAEYRELRIRKRTHRKTLAVGVELRLGGDVVNVTVTGQTVSVARGGRSIDVDSPEALSAVQELLGGSAAVFGARAMLSDLEPVSDLTAPDMALLSTAAFVASLVGDVGAPQRIADRFMEKHRGIYRQMRDSGQCWSDYTTEATAAWNELQACMDDAENRGFFRAAYERIACNAIWLMRSESAWFEYLSCLSPLSFVPQ